MPRSIHASPQPRTQVIVVFPPGASTTGSKSGTDICALATAQPVPSNAAATRVLTMIVLIEASCCFVATIRERRDPAVLVAIKDLVAGLPRDPELGAQRRHLLALEQAGDKPEPLVHDVTLLPRHALSALGGKVSPMCPEYGVTYPSGRDRSIESITCETDYSIRC